MSTDSHVDPSDGMNHHMDEHLTMWGVDITAQFREHPRLHFPPNGLSPRIRAKTTEVVLALHIKDTCQTSPEDGHPYLIGAGDIERLRDLLWFAEKRGLVSEMLVVDLNDEPDADGYRPLHTREEMDGREQT